LPAPGNQGIYRSNFFSDYFTIRVNDFCGRYIQLNMIDVGSRDPFHILLIKPSSISIIVLFDWVSWQPSLYFYPMILKIGAIGFIFLILVLPGFIL
jgi:hypothetical protein